jgi:lipid II:glycine glycyltransferase (peptidoglycan interpeptide bridge formation enzyme)
MDGVTQDRWHSITGQFRDVSIYQTWAYGAVRFGSNNLSHIVLQRDSAVVAAAQVAIKKVPVIGAGVAYVRRGPLWKMRDSKGASRNLTEMLKAMREEYVIRRGLLLRVVPNQIDFAQDDLRSIFESNGYRWTESDERTLFLDLSQSTQALHSNMSKGWRRNLNKAEGQSLEIVQGTDRHLFESVYRLYQEMLSRKQFVPGIDIDEYRELQERLPDDLKMQIMVCCFEGKAVAGLIGSAIGEVGIYLIGATGDRALELGGSYLLHIKMIDYLRGRGCRYYNLNGINPERNPGGYQFKSGLCGKKGLDIRFPGVFEACHSPASRLSVRVGEMAREGRMKAVQVARHLSKTISSR